MVGCLLASCACLCCKKQAQCSGANLGSQDGVAVPAGLGLRRLRWRAVCFAFCVLLRRTTCALTVVAVAVAASIPAAAARITPEDDEARDCDSHHQAPAGPESSGGSSSGAWLLGDEEDGLHDAKSRGQGRKHRQPDGRYQPPLFQDAADVCPAKDTVGDERHVLLVVDSPASDDTDSLGSIDQLPARDQSSRH